jgi:hypothetical protein
MCSALHKTELKPDSKQNTCSWLAQGAEEAYPSDFDKLVCIVMAVEERLFPEDHARERTPEGPQVEAVVIVLQVYQQLWTLHTKQSWGLFVLTLQNCSCQRRDNTQGTWTTGAPEQVMQSTLRESSSTPCRTEASCAMMRHMCAMLRS